ncbi:MAG: hypothetical protein ABSC50_02060 [Candidatus Bathyarchaeia archaeon]
MQTQGPVVTADEVFAVSEKVRWVALALDRGDVLLNQMRPGVQSYSSPQFDREFVTLGPLTVLGVCEKYSEYVKGVDYVVVWFGLVACVYARLGGQVLAVSIERDRQAVVDFLGWLERKQREIAEIKHET